MKNGNKSIKNQKILKDTSKTRKCHVSAILEIPKNESQSLIKISLEKPSNYFFIFHNIEIELFSVCGKTLFCFPFDGP
jgi:hypothetical protein